MADILGVVWLGCCGIHLPFAGGRIVAEMRSARCGNPHRGRDRLLVC
jgi:hypothetical protein